MAFDDRLGFLLLGGAIGFILGYIVRSLREIKEELDEVDAIVKRRDHGGNDRGAVSLRLVEQSALVVVLILVVYAAFSSQVASNNSNNAQDNFKSQQQVLARVTTCNKVYLSKALSALNERTTYSEAQVNSNVDLQTSFSQLLGILLHKPPFSESKRDRATANYYQDLTKFISIADKTKRKQLENPFPETSELDACLSNTGTPTDGK
jgi:hypothetical protein